MFLFPGSQVSQTGSGTGLKAMGKPLAKTVEIIICPTPASSPASSEFHRPQPLGQPPVSFSKQEKLKVDLPHTEKFGNSYIIQLF